MFRPSQYCDLPHNTQLLLTIWQLREGRPCALVGTTSMAMFNKKGRLKTGLQRISISEHAAGDSNTSTSDTHTQQPEAGAATTTSGQHSSDGGRSHETVMTSTARGAAAAAANQLPTCPQSPDGSKPPLASRGNVGRLEHVLKLYQRGELPQVDSFTLLFASSSSQMLI